MHINIPSFPDPSRTIPITNAYGWIAFEALDGNTGTGRITLNIHPDADSANAFLTPATRLDVSLGELLNPASPGEPAMKFPSLMELMANPDFAQAYGIILYILYTALLNHPKLEGSTIVMEG